MPFWRRKAWRAVSRISSEPTDSLLYGAFISQNTLDNIKETDYIAWIREGAEPGGEVNEQGYPQAWRSGRELARARYAERLKNLEPIPRDSAGRTTACVREATALQGALIASLKFDVNEGGIGAEEVSSSAMQACYTSYAPDPFKTVHGALEVDR